MKTHTSVPALVYAALEGERAIPLTRPETTLGRSPDNDVVLLEAFVSRHHALVQRAGAIFEVVDRKSSHGVYLNGERVKRSVLAPGDVLQLGSIEAVKITFRLQNKEEEQDTGSVPDLLKTLSVLNPFHGSEEDNRKPAAREMEQLNFLLSAARQLNSGGAIGDILRALLQLTLELTGVDRGFVFLREGSGMRLAQGLRKDGMAVEEDATVSRRAMQRAIESDAKVTVSDTLADQVASGWDSIVVNNIRSIFCIPLRKRVSTHKPNELLGLLYLDSQTNAGDLCALDHELLDAISDEAAALLHNALLAQEEFKARQAQEELAVAARIHSNLMSITLPVLPYALLQARSKPCLAIGGDFYDAVALDGSVVVTIADVSGKGVSAAIVAATLQGIIHAQLLAKQQLPDIASLLNQFLCTRNVGKYVTMVLVRLFSDGRVEYMNCGHVQPLVVSGSTVRRLEASNLIVGLLPFATYASSQCVLAPGDRILLVTDGLTEAENAAGVPLGEDGLDALAVGGDLEQILEQIARYHPEQEAQDDCTMLEVRFLGAGADPGWGETAARSLAAR